MAIQEARTTKEGTAQIMGVIPKVKIFTNGQYSSKMGVVFTINKDLVDENNLHHKIMIPNRASKLKVKWGKDQELILITIYAPNLKN